MSRILTTVLLTLALASPFRAEADCDRSPLLISGGRVWQGERFLPDTDLLIAEGRIVALGARGTLEIPEGTRTLTAAGHSVIPGLIDGHAHFFELGGPVPEGYEADPENNAFVVNGRQLLMAGVTSARVHLFDLELGPRLQSRAADDCFAAPRLQIAGPGFFGGRAGLERKQVWGVTGPDDARAKVRRVHAAGARWVAIHDADRFEPGELEAIVEEARRQGLAVLAAGERSEEIARAVEVGVDSIDYMERTPRAGYPEALMARLRSLERPPTFVPMLGYYQRFVAYRHSSVKSALGPLGSLLPPDVSRHLLDGLRVQLDDDEEYEQKLAALTTYAKKFEQLRDANLPLAAGTDCGSPGHFHYDAIWWEIRAWQSLGATPRDALRAATAGGSRLLRDDGVGRLEVGARGDVVIYAGDPLDDRPDAKKVTTVVKGGVVFVDGRLAGKSL